MNPIESGFGVWIPVDLALPPVLIDVLLFVPGPEGGVEMGYLTRTPSVFAPTETLVCSAVAASHWMPLPPPPFGSEPCA
ncbi:MAG: hypothetical protein AUJ55_11675 [Proteobacteria bacterium CG1_02_64_396]|nr:MAG: hypothetical protein AUJ55_11675 [Proteobacteria bacterium CG1_02_64_396]